MTHDEILQHEQIEYAHKRLHRDGTEYYCDVYPDPTGTRLCGKGKVLKLHVRAAREGEVSRYWGWWDAQRKQFSMIWPARDLLDMCFPYGPQAEEERGRGVRVNLVLEEIQEHT